LAPIIPQLRAEMLSESKQTIAAATELKTVERSTDDDKSSTTTKAWEV